jgi:putative ABC transport system permease protein
MAMSNLFRPLQIVVDSLFHPITCAILGLIPVLAGLVFLYLQPKLFLVVIKNLRRNLLRTSLTCAAIMVLVFMVSLIWTVVSFIDNMTSERAADIKLIITEKWMLPSQMPPTHAKYLNPEDPNFLPELKGLIKPGNYMSWSFYGGSTDPDPKKFSLDNIVFFFCMDPHHIIPMMDELDTLDPALVQKLVRQRNGCLLGPERMAKIGKRVGDRFKLYGLNYKEIDLEFEIVGELPEGRYGLSGIMNDSYFNGEIDRFAQQKGRKHDLDLKRLNLIWLRVPDRATFDKVGNIIEHASVFANTPVKVETASSLVGNFLDAYRDLLMGFKYVLVPAILVIMSLVVANSISISVRERRAEMAVLKVLGFSPTQILAMVLGEALLVGLVAGLAASATAYAVINLLIGGIPFPVGFFPRFMVPGVAFLWGLAIGSVTSIVGSFWPAQSARAVKVSEVFSKVA